MWELVSGELCLGVSVCARVGVGLRGAVYGVSVCVCVCVCVFSVAIVMWELLTGLIPWKGMDIVQIIQQARSLLIFYYSCCCCYYCYPDHRAVV